MAHSPAAYDPIKYPLVTKLGLTIIHSDDDSPPGVSGEDIKRVFEERGLTMAWRRWCASGLTCAKNGIYPWDVESFLSGRVNED